LRTKNIVWNSRDHEGVEFVFVQLPSLVDRFSLDEVGPWGKTTMLVARLVYVDSPEKTAFG
jgi:hypothetical protein